MNIPNAFIYELAGILGRARSDAQYIAQRELIEDTTKQVASMPEAFRVMSMSEFLSVSTNYRQPTSTTAGIGSYGGAAGQGMSIGGLVAPVSPAPYVDYSPPPLVR